MVEQGPPGLLFRFGPVAQAQQRMHERDLRRVHVGRRRVPPIVDHDVERVERLDLVPPERGIEEQVARLEIGHQGGGERFPGARIGVQVGIAQVDHAHHLTAGSRRQRPRIEIAHLVGREEGEAATADHAAGDVVGHVVMGCGHGAVADPDSDQRRPAFEPDMVEADPVLGAQAGKIVVDVGRADIEGRRVRPPLLGQDRLQQLVERDPAGFEIEAGDRLVVEEPAADFRLALVGHDRLAAIESKEIVGGGPRAIAGRGGPAASPWPRP